MRVFEAGRVPRLRVRLLLGALSWWTISGGLIRTTSAAAKIRVTALGGDNKTKSIFTGETTVRVDKPVSEDRLRALVKQIFPHQEGTLGDLLKIGRVIANAEVLIYGGSFPDDIRMSVKAPGYYSEVSIIPTAGGYALVKNRFIQVDHEGAGTGTRLLGHQVKAVTSLADQPIRYLTATARTYWSGLTWRKMGYFDNSLAASDEPRRLVFDLAPGSLSRKTLEHYLRKKKVRLGSLDIAPLDDEAKRLLSAAQ